MCLCVGGGGGECTPTTGYEALLQLLVHWWSFRSSSWYAVNQLLLSIAADTNRIIVHDRIQASDHLTDNFFNTKSVQITWLNILFIYLVVMLNVFDIYSRPLWSFNFLVVLRFLLLGFCFTFFLLQFRLRGFLSWISSLLHGNNNNSKDYLSLKMKKPRRRSLFFLPSVHVYVIIPVAYY